MDSAKTRLAEAERHYRAGDFRTARAICRELLAGEADDDVRRRANEIMTATGVDPMAIAAFCLSASILIYLIVHYLL